MFGTRSFGSRLQPSLSDQLAQGGGININRSAFGQMGGAAQPMPGAAQMMNSANLDMLGNRQFAGFQADEGRELQRLLQQRELANNVQLAGIDQNTQFGVQDRRNSGAIDQINAGGSWERAITGDKLGSNERLSSLQRELDMAMARGGWEQQGLDRGSREKMSLAEQANLLERQKMVGDQSLAQIGAQGGVSMGLLGEEGRQAALRQQVGGQQALEQLGLQNRGAMNLQGLQNAGQLGVTQLGEQGANYRTGLTTNANRDISRDELRAAMERAKMGDSTTRYGIDKEADTQQQGYLHQGQMMLNEQAFRSGEAKKTREHTTAENLADRLSQYGTPEHTGKLRELAVAAASSQAVVAQANAQKAQAEAMRATDPRMSDTLFREADAKAAAAETALALAKKNLDNSGVDRERIEAEIERYKAETQSILNPRNEKVETVKGLRDLVQKDPSVSITSEDFAIDPTKFVNPTPTLTPEVIEDVQNGAKSGITLKGLRRKYPNVSVGQLEELLQRSQRFPYGGSAADYAPSYGLSY